MPHITVTVDVSRETFTRLVSLAVLHGFQVHGFKKEKLPKDWTREDMQGAAHWMAGKLLNGV